MPWELTIVNAQDRSQPLGTREEVIARVAAALPGVVLQQAPGPDAAMIAQMPAILREHFLRPRPLNADFDGGDFSIQFYATNQPEIMTLGVEVRGNGNPLAPLAALCQPNGWSVVNDTDDTVVDLAVQNLADWDTFRAWRDNAVESLRSRGLPDE